MFAVILVFLYGFGKLYFLNDKRKWNIFTRVISTMNALQCITMVCREIYNLDMSKNPSINSIYFFPEQESINSLFMFCSYLFVDGIFQFPELYTNFSFGLILSILHHLVGGYGIYLIAKTKMGFFLGFYFAMTELSTPFLNLSWGFRKNYIFYIFYILFFQCRILTIPLVINYLNSNAFVVLGVYPIHRFMFYYGTYALISLNLVWFIFLTLKFKSLKK